MCAAVLKILKPWNQTGHRHPHFFFHTEFHIVISYFHIKPRKPTFSTVRLLKLNADPSSLALISGYLSFADIQSSVSFMLPSSVFKFLSQDSLLRFVSFTEVN